MTANALRRAGAVVALGSGLGYGITLLLTPLVTRIFSPTEFGAFATSLAVASLFTGVSTWRLEVRAQGEANDRAADALYRTAWRSALAFGVLLSIFAVLGVEFADLPRWTLWVGIMVLAGSVQLLGVSVLSRRRQYKQLAAGNLVQGGGMGAAQVGLGLLSPVAGSLAGGFAVVRLVWVPVLWRVLGRGPGVPSQDTAVRRYARIAGTGALVNSGAGQAPLLLVAVAFTDAQLGLFAMAVRLLVSPLSIVGQAVAAASLGEIGHSVREANHSMAQRLAKSGMRDLVLLGTVPCGLAAVLGPLLASPLLGGEWADVGWLLTALSVGALCQFAVAPFAQLLNVVGASARLLRWDILRLALTALALMVPALFGASLFIAAGVYSVSTLVAYVVLARLVLRTLVTESPSRAAEVVQ